MNTAPDPRKKSLKKEVVHLLDEYLLGHISAKDLIQATIPLLMVSENKRGRKNYIEKYLMELGGKSEAELSRDYVFEVRETIKGDRIVSQKDRSKLMRRALRKLIERYLYDEINEEYYLSTLSDLMFDYHQEIGFDQELKNFFDRLLSVIPPAENLEATVPKTTDAEWVLNETADFYDSYFKGVWDG